MPRLGNRRWVVGIVGVVGSLALSVVPAHAAKVIAGNARWVSIRAQTDGVALITYYSHGHTYHTLAWGAKNALAPSPSRPQVHFTISYAGGYGTFLGLGYWQHVRSHNACGRYQGPRLWRMVAACTMPDGSSWAVQAWQGDLRDNGWTPTARARQVELFLSHWSGELPKLWFKADWTYAGAPGGPFDEVYGRFTYQGHPVYGYSSTSRGAPTDSYGRLIALDTYNPPWDRGYRQPDGWWRQNSFLVHRPYGDFCAGVFRRVNPLPPRTYPGRGTAYRIVANGPGVTPVVEWQSAPPGYYQPGLSNVFPTAMRRGPYNATLDHELNQDQKVLDPRPSTRSSCYYTH